jgi:hypothetical protein
LGIELLMNLGGEMAQVASEQQLVLSLARRASGDTEEACELAFNFATASLRDVRRNRDGRLAQVRREAIALVIGKAAGVRNDSGSTVSSKGLRLTAKHIVQVRDL